MAKIRQGGDLSPYGKRVNVPVSGGMKFGGGGGSNVPGNPAGQSDGVRQRYRMATGGGPLGGNFGAMPMSSHSADPSGRGHFVAGQKASRDGGRTAGLPVKHTRGRKPAQANPDHGDH